MQSILRNMKNKLANETTSKAMHSICSDNVSRVSPTNTYQYNLMDFLQYNIEKDIIYVKCINQQQVNNTKTVFDGT